MTTGSSRPLDQVEAMCQRMARLRGDLGGASESPHAPALEETFEAFGVTLEELRVAEEHLIHANEVLLTTRHQLDAERRRYRDLFDLAPDGFLVTDGLGVVLEANRAAAAMLGSPQVFMEGKVLANFVAEADRRDFRGALADAATGLAPTPWKLRLKPRHGGPVEAEVSVSGGTAAGPRGRELLWLVRDVSGRVPPAPADEDPSAAALAERDRLRDLIDAVGAVIWEADPVDGRLTFVSREIEAVLGRPAESLLDVPGAWTAHTHPEDRAMVESLRSKQLADQTDLEMEYRFVTADGRHVWVRDVSRFNTATGGEPPTLRGVLLNINKRKRIERRLYYTKGAAESQVRELSYLQELSQRLSLSIDLPAVLEEILAAASALQGASTAAVWTTGPGPGGLKVAAALGLSDEFLEGASAPQLAASPWARAAAENRTVVVEDVEAAEEYEEYRGLFRLEGVRGVVATPLTSLAGDRLGVLVTFFAQSHHASEQVQGLVELYARHAGQVIANAGRHAALVDADRARNAALDTVGPALRVPLAAMDSALRRLADPTTDADDRQGALAALGLRLGEMRGLVDGLVDPAGAESWGEPRRPEAPGVVPGARGPQGENGTRGREPSADVGGTARPGGRDETTGRPLRARNRALRILVVGDDAVTAAALDRLVQVWGHEVLTAAPGAGASRAEGPDVVLLDLDTSDADGPAVAARLRAAYPAPLKVLAVTRNHPPDEAGHARPEGVDRLFVKPLDLDALREALNETPLSAPSFDDDA